MDPLGNQVKSTIDEYGIPIPGHGTAGYVDHNHTGGQQLHCDGVMPEVMRRSGDSSSNSSEDDGLVGRRKKDKAGIKDKIKEKLAGGHNKDVEGITGGVQTQEKKVIMKKIRKKLPGSHSN